MKMAACNRMEHLRTWANSWVEGGSYPGVVVGMYDAQGTEVFYHEVTGAAEKAKGSTACYKRDSIFRIFSMTKPVTAVAAMILVERGLLALHDKVSKWIPAFTGTTVLRGGTADAPLLDPMVQEITIYHLLTHTSGIGYGFTASVCDELLARSFGCPLGDTIHLSLSDLCNGIAAAPLNFQPGTGYLYGLNLDVLGHIVELVSGDTLDRFFAREIFEPLGMVDTAFYVPPEKMHRLLPCYDRTPGHSYVLGSHPMNDKEKMPTCLQGGALLVSTLFDYSRFLLCLLNNGEWNGHRILTPESVKWMSTNQLPDGKDMDDLLKSDGFFGAGRRRFWLWWCNVYGD